MDSDGLGEGICEMIGLQVRDSQRKGYHHTLLDLGPEQMSYTAKQARKPATSHHSEE